MFRMFLRNMCTGTNLKAKTPIPVFGIEGRYVTALYSAANQMNELEAAEKSLRSLFPLLTKPKVLEFIESSMISRADKGKLMAQIGQEAGFPKSASNFLALVAENGRLKKLRRMVTMFLAVMVAHRSEVLCEVITAKPLDDSTRKSLLDALKKFVKGDKKVQLTEKVDPTIIGGMIVGIQDKHIDLSIARKIQMYTEILKQAV